MAGPSEPFAALIVPIPREDGPSEPPPGFEGDAHPDHTLPGDLPTPTHPIVLPPEGQPPLVIWGPPDGRPTPPIHLPGMPDLPEKPPEGAPKFEWRTGWTEEHGWVVVGVPQFPTPAPSKKK